MSIRLVPTALALIFFSRCVQAQSSYPMLMSLSPVAACRNQTSEHTLDARYSMYGAYDVIVTGSGVTGRIVTPMEPDKDGKIPSMTKIKVQFQVESDALPGVRDFRIVGPTGPSTLGQLVIVRDPVVQEEPKNDTADTAQAIPVPSAVCGTVERAEDVDFYRFTIETPGQWTFHCRGMRLQDRIHDLQTHIDPIITIRDAKSGSTLAAADNNFAADPFLTFDFRKGDYLLEVRDVRYSGNAYWNYCIEINNRPFVSSVYPASVQRGQTSELQLIGSGLSSASVVRHTAAENTDACVQETALSLEGDTTNPVPVLISDLPVVMETEKDNNSVPSALPIEIPAAVTGRIETEADIDCFAFTATKGEHLTLEIKGRRYSSGLDSNLRILNAEGKQLVENDDMRLWSRMTAQDSQIENWVVPADGTYIAEVRDVHLRGGPDFVYTLEITRAEPHFELVADSDKTWLTPGGAAAIFVRIVRKNGFDGEVQLNVDGLPDGVQAECGRILSGKNEDGCIILMASPDAKMAASNITICGTAVTGRNSSDADKPTAGLPLSAVAVAMQETYMPGGGRSHWPVEIHTVAVGQPSSADVLQVKISTNELTLKRGQSGSVDVEVIRQEGYDKNITLDLLYQHLSSKFANTLPEGVTVDLKNSQTLLTGSKSTGKITLTAAENAPLVRRQQCAVMANVSINFVMKATYSSEPLFVSVTE